LEEYVSPPVTTVPETNPMKDTGQNVKLAGTYIHYLLTLLGGPKTNTELSKFLGLPASDASRDIARLMNASQALIEVEPLEKENARGRKLISLTPFGKQIADLALRNIRLNQQLARLGPVDQELLDFLLEKTRAVAAQTRTAAWQGLESQANRERIWDSVEVWELLNDALTKESRTSEYVEYATRLLQNFAIRAFSPAEDDRTRRLVEEKIRELIEKRGGKEIFWRSIVNETDPFFAQRSNMIGILKSMLKPEAFFEECWKLLVWRAKKDKVRPKDDIDDTRFWNAIDPIMIEIQSTPQAIKRKKIEEAFSLMEDDREIIKERAARMLRHLMR
jgi:DNA-binding MarR family transcriptional regulator